MQVTKVDLYKYNPQPKGICAECSIVLDGELCIYKIQVLNGKNGLYIKFPNTGMVSVVHGKKRYKDIIRPLSNDLRTKISDAIFKEYEKLSN